MVRFSVNVGPDSPMWLYSHGVPLVKVIGEKEEKHGKFDAYPFYPDAMHKTYFYELIK